MSEAKLDVIVKAINFMEYTMTVTSNRKRYPVKHLMLVKRIQNRCMDIYEHLLNANRLNLETSRSERLELQTKAISCCDQLSCYIELSMKLNLIGSDTVSYWQKQVADIKYMTIAWRSKDKQR
jgi:signal transduction protein with GAF and PtsI domain